VFKVKIEKAFSMFTLSIICLVVSVSFPDTTSRSYKKNCERILTAELALLPAASRTQAEQKL